MESKESKRLFGGYLEVQTCKITKKTLLTMKQTSIYKGRKVFTILDILKENQKSRKKEK